MTIGSFFNKASRALTIHPFSSNFLLLCTISGGGVVALSESQSEAERPNIEDHQSQKKKVVVLGTGWAATSFLKGLDGSLYDVQVVSPRNYFAFTPLLPSVTCGSVEARSIVEPVRNIIKKRNGEIKFWEAECVKIDAAEKKVVCRSNIENLVGSGEFSLDYDFLVVAVGAQVNTFNTPGVKENCHFLKSVEDAQKIRLSVIDCLEKAVLPSQSEEEQRSNLHFVVVGGGPTGVEFAAELHDFIQEDLKKLYPTVQDKVKITLIQSGDHILNMFDERISSFAEKKFTRDGIEVQTGCRVMSVDDKEIKMKVKSTGAVCSVPHGLVIWSTGISTLPVIRDFMEEIGQTKRHVLATDEWLRVKGCEDVFAIGDCSSINQRKIMDDIMDIFKAADKNNSGTLTVEEFEEVMDDVILRYPQVEYYLNKKHILDLRVLWNDPQGNERKEIDIEGFKLALSVADSQVKTLPATAQVAAQQGAYLASCFNRVDDTEEHPEGPRRFSGSGHHRFRPFRYKHFGQFAPLGGEQAAAELPGDWVSMQAKVPSGVDLEEEEKGEGVEKSEFWKQPDGLGYKPCLDFSRDYRRESDGIVKNRKRYLMVVVSGGMNQQRNQIVDAVVIARILGAALVVPILQVNVIWGDESEFADIFDFEHFKNVLANDVRVVSSLPSTHLMTKPVEGSPPLHVTPSWIRSRYLKRFNREGVLLLRSLDSRLSKDLPSDLQKLRCKVAFSALRFAKPVQELGNKIAERMQSKGPYLALHLRMEKDVWVRTGCLPGLSPEFDEIVKNERRERPELLKGRSNMTYHERKMAGLCPLTAMDVTRLLKALGAQKDARIYWAGGQPLGGKEALHPLIHEFPHLYNKEDLALPGELEPFAKKASLMAAIDYIVSEKSDVFMPSHGGNMGHALQGHRAYAGHKKYITPNKRQMHPYFLNSSLPEAEFNSIVKELHQNSLGQPELRTSKVGRDVTKYPVPECMCNDSHNDS